MRTTMISLLLLCLLTSKTPAWAVKSDYVQRLSRARSAGEVQKIKAQFEELQVANKACRLQMQMRQAPMACYESLQAEIRWGLHAKIKEQIRLRSRLDEFCTTAAENLRVPRHIPASVSMRCRREVAAAIEILAYKDSRPNWSEN